MIEVGFERDSLNEPRAAIRWWFIVNAEPDELAAFGLGRNQKARRGVVDRGFRFARGGRASSETEARGLIADANAAARVEHGYWLHQPSHALGSRGELVPLDEGRLELDG